MTLPLFAAWADRSCRPPLAIPRAIPDSDAPDGHDRPSPEAGHATALQHDPAGAGQALFQDNKVMNSTAATATPSVIK